GTNIAGNPNLTITVPATRTYGEPALTRSSSRTAIESGTPSCIGAPTSRAPRMPACVRRLALSRATCRSTPGGSSPRAIQWLPPCIVRWLWQSTIAGTLVAPPASPPSASVVSAASLGRIHEILPSSMATLMPARSESDVPSASAASWSTTRVIAAMLGSPVQDDLAALAGAHDLECLREVLRREAVRDHGGDVETALQHRAHAVPGLEHLAAVDPLQGEAAEDHLVPIDRDLLIRDAEKRDAAAVVHEREHRAKRRGAAGHLEPDVESLEHSELFHHSVERRRREVHRERRAKPARESEPVVVAVGDDDVACADESADRRGHHADRARAGDEDIFASELERQRAVHGVAERVEAGADLVGHPRRQDVRVRRRNADVLGECARPLHADTDRVAAEMTPPGAAVAAMPAGHMALDRDALAYYETAHLAADLGDRALELVTDDERDRDRLLRPRVPIPDVKIGAADRRVVDAHEEIVGADRGTRGVLEPDPRLSAALHERAHQITPRARPTFANAVTARSTCS